MDRLDRIQKYDAIKEFLHEYGGKIFMGGFLLFMIILMFTGIDHAMNPSPEEQAAKELQEQQDILYKACLNQTAYDYCASINASLYWINLKPFLENDFDCAMLNRSRSNTRIEFYFLQTEKDYCNKTAYEAVHPVEDNSSEEVYYANYSAYQDALVAYYHGGYKEGHNETNSSE